MDMQKFLQNRQQFPLDELAKYSGKHIAWSPDEVPLRPVAHKTTCLFVQAT